MYIATHTRVTRDIHILAQFIKYHIVIHIKMIKKWKLFQVTVYVLRAGTIVLTVIDTGIRLLVLVKARW